MRHRLFLLQPSLVFAARVNMPGTITYPLDELTYDTVTYDGTTNIAKGMTLLLGSAPGLDDYGRQRVRGSVVTFPSPIYKIPIGRTGKGVLDGELDVHDNAYITILDDFRVWAKISRIHIQTFTTDIYKDSDIDPYPDVYYPPPKANAGIGYAGTMNPTTGLATIKFSANGSFQWDDAVSSKVSFPTSVQWILVDGTFTSGTEISTNITATFPPGFRWVRLNVYSNVGVAGVTPMHTMRVPVYVRDPANDLSFSEFQISQHTEGITGCEMNVVVFKDISREDYPDGTLAMIWDDEDSPDIETGRSHMLFVGWMQDEQGDVSPQPTGVLRNTNLHLVDVIGRLKRLPGWSQILEYSSAATAWNETRFPNILYYAFYLLQWHSTALDVADFTNPDTVLSHYEYKVLSSDEGNLYDQVNTMVNNVTPDYYFTCNRKGQMFLVVDQNIQFLGDRDGENALELLDEQWISVQYAYDRSPRLYQMISYAVTGGRVVSTPIAAVTPDEFAFGQGLSKIETSQRLTQNQTQFNIVEGNHYARINARVTSMTVVIPGSLLPSSYDPALMGWVLVSINTASSRPHRGPLDPADPSIDVRTICQSMSIAYDYQRTGLIRTVTMTLQMESSGPAATTKILSVEE